MNLARLVLRSASVAPDQPAVVQGPVVRTYAELADRVARLARVFHDAGLRPGDRVAIIQWNSPELIETLLAAFHGGFIAVPVNARSTVFEAAALLADADVRAIVYGAEYAEHAAGDVAILRLATADGQLDRALEGVPPLPPHPSRPDDVAWLFYTSGTTGRPKGAMLTHRNLHSMITSYLADIRLVHGHHRVLHAAPLTHGGGLYALPGIAQAATQILTTSRSYDPDEMLTIIEREGITDIAFLTPTMVRWLTERQVERRADVSRLEHVVYGGAPMYLDDLHHALDTFGPIFSQIYGQAEAPVTISRLTREDHQRALAHAPDRLSSTGWPYLGVEVGVCGPDGVITDRGEGEVVTRSDAVMAGYWANPDATAVSIQDGWLHTGDVGSLEADGTLVLKDRTKDVIISGGANIYPREVEELLLLHEQVRQVVVVGAPDETWGERVVAVLVAQPGVDREVLAKDLDALCRERLSDYKRPRQFDWRDELPTSSYGKVLKREIRSAYWSDHDRQI